MLFYSCIFAGEKLPHHEITIIPIGYLRINRHEAFYNDELLHPRIRSTISTSLNIENLINVSFEYLFQDVMDGGEHHTAVLKECVRVLRKCYKDHKKWKQ